MWVAFCLRAFVAGHTDSWYMCLLLTFYSLYMIPAVLNLHVYVVPKAFSVLQYITEHGNATTNSNRKLKKGRTHRNTHTHTHTHTDKYKCMCVSSNIQ
jgi:hypothetical protein